MLKSFDIIWDGADFFEHFHVLDSFETYKTILVNRKNCDVDHLSEITE